MSDLDNISGAWKTLQPEISMHISSPHVKQEGVAGLGSLYGLGLVAMTQGFVGLVIRLEAEDLTAKRM